MNTKIPLAAFMTFARLTAAMAGLALWALAAPALAQSGAFTYVTGGVTLERDGRPITPMRGTPVRPRDVIKSLADGYAQLAMVDGARMSLRSNSQLIVQEYPVAPTDAGALLTLVRGTLRIFTVALSGPQKAGYRMQTKVATVGIRGSGSILESTEDDVTNHYTIEGNYVVGSPLCCDQCSSSSVLPIRRRP